MFPLVASWHGTLSSGDVVLGVLILQQNTKRIRSDTKYRGLILDLSVLLRFLLG